MIRSGHPDPQTGASRRPAWRRLGERAPQVTHSIYYANLSKLSEMKRVTAEIAAAEPRIDVLINNAGIIQPGLVNLADTDDALFDRIMAINVKGTFNTLRLAAKQLRKGGRIGGAAAASRTAAERSASAKKGAATRKRNAEHTVH